MSRGVVERELPKADGAGRLVTEKKDEKTFSTRQKVDSPIIEVEIKRQVNHSI